MDAMRFEGRDFAARTVAGVVGGCGGVRAVFVDRRGKAGLVFGGDWEGLGG